MYSSNKDSNPQNRENPTHEMSRKTINEYGRGRNRERVEYPQGEPAKPLFSGSNPDAASNNIPPFQKNNSVNDATPLQSLSFPQAIRKY